MSNPDLEMLAEVAEAKAALAWARRMEEEWARIRSRMTRHLLRMVDNEEAARLDRIQKEEELALLVRGVDERGRI